MKKGKWFICILCIGFCTACSRTKQEQQQEPLARVYDKYLYPSDLQNMIPENSSSEDSIKISDEFINNWIRHNLILKIAEDNLPNKLSEIDKQAKDYRESLVIYAYEKQWLAENLDTIVYQDSLKAYYDNAAQEFILKSNIYKLSYAIIPASVTGYDTLKRLMSRDVTEVRNDLETFCAVHCKTYLIDSQNWLSEDALFKILPVQLFENNKLREMGMAEYADESNKYIVTVHSVRNSGTIAPFEFVKNDIRQMIIGKRKMQILKNNYQNMYLDGLKKENAEIY